MNNLLSDLKKWLTIWFWIVMMLWLAWVSYAAFTWFTALQATPAESLTLTKWNDMVDAVKDEYKTDWSEVLTSKIWDWKPVYRKVITATVNTDNTATYVTLVHNDAERIFIEEVYVFVPAWNWHISMTAWQPWTFHLWASFNYWTKSINVYSNHSSVIWLQSEVIVEYTKTTD